jgi:AraC-like DNA-binding protein
VPSLKHRDDVHVKESQFRATTTARLAPDPRLAGLVRTYQLRRADFSDSSARIPLPARPDLTLDFYFTRSTLIEERSTGIRDFPPAAVVIGPQTYRRVDVLVSGRMDGFSVQFEPTGLHALFGIAMPEVIDEAFSAENLFGPALARELYERLAEESTLTRRVSIIEAQFIKRVRTRQRDPIAEAAAILRSTSGATRVEQLAASSGLSPRQFTRLFIERVGMAPKTYARVLRLNAAIAAKSANPGVSWAEIAQQFGYFDQAHLNKDFLDLADASPTAFMSGF